MLRVKETLYVLAHFWSSDNPSVPCSVGAKMFDSFSIVPLAQAVMLVKGLCEKDQA